jgi:peroxiredoxin
MKKLGSNVQRNWDEYEHGARELIKQFPDQPDGYQYLMVEIEYGPHTKARALAKTMLDSSTPERFKSWAKGFIYRLDSIGKPVTMQFVALDGREVDLAKMNGKVVLIDFWGTDCPPCVAALREIKTAYNKYHAQGFEVIGISFDSDKARLARFIKDKQYPWPQYFEDKQGMNNKYAQEFGIDAIPHMLLVDKKGCLRLGQCRTGPLFETYIANFLAEP